MYHYDDDAFDEDGEGIHDGSIIQIVGAVSSGFLARIYSEEWVAARFGRNYRSVLIPIERLAAHVDMLFTPPAIDLGITFSPFQFPEDVEAADSFDELLSDIWVMDQRFEVYYEGSNSVPQAWFDNYLDTALAARFIPLIRNSRGDLLFHGPHFFTLLDYLALNANFARILSTPGGTNHTALSIHYNSAQ
jgi:hypothetical protein